ncbi:MAG: glycerol-3-phosphate acyltransferase [Clostridia bacterium]|nr:glycerol-3-phosphate acyltransferase [Clostridia bacterium]
MINWLLFSAIAVCSYFLGNVNNAVILSKLKKNDIRKLGSGNPGTMNMSRNFGIVFGVLTLVLDAVKGIIPSLVGYFVFKGQYAVNGIFEFSDLAKYSFGLCAVLGHIYPVIYKFKGGKGIATTIGSMFACSITSGYEWVIVAVMAWVAAIVFIYFAEYGAMGSFIAITPPAIGQGIYLFFKYAGFKAPFSNNILYIVSCLLIFFICFFTLFAHRKNIERMLSGEEHPTSIKQMIFKFKEKRRLKKIEKEQNN